VESLSERLVELEKSFSPVLKPIGLGVSSLAFVAAFPKKKVFSKNTEYKYHTIEDLIGS